MKNWFKLSQNNPEDNTGRVEKLNEIKEIARNSKHSYQLLDLIDALSGLDSKNFKILKIYSAYTLPIIYRLSLNQNVPTKGWDTLWKNYLQPIAISNTNISDVFIKIIISLIQHPNCPEEIQEYFTQSLLNEDLNENTATQLIIPYLVKYLSHGKDPSHNITTSAHLFEKILENKFLSPKALENLFDTPSIKKMPEVITAIIHHPNVSPQLSQKAIEENPLNINLIQNTPIVHDILYKYPLYHFHLGDNLIQKIINYPYASTNVLNKLIKQLGIDPKVTDEISNQNLIIPIATHQFAPIDFSTQFFANHPQQFSQYKELIKNPQVRNNVLNELFEKSMEDINLDNIHETS